MKEEDKEIVWEFKGQLTVAKELMNIGYPSDAASKIHYSIFYAVQVLLKKEKPA